MKRFGRRSSPNTFLSNDLWCGKVLRRCFTFVLLLAMPWLNAHGAEGVGSGDRLRFWQKIQGPWQNHCESIGHGVSKHYAFNKITISYTHIRIERREYAEAQCLKPQAIIHESYSYTLVEPVKAINGEQAYGLNLTREGTAQGLGLLFPHNILSFGEGKLYFGLWLDDMRSDRLQKLDIRNPYFR